MRPIPARAVLVLVALAPFAIPANADWPPEGLLVSTQPAFRLMRNAYILPLPSGNLAVIGMGSDGNTNSYHLQQLEPGGSIAAGWPAAGVEFTAVLRSVKPRAHSFVVDDQSHVWHTWTQTNGRAYVQALAADATSWPGFPTEFDLGSTGGGPTHATAAQGGQLYVAWSTRLKRITSTGASAPGWASTGVTLPGYSYADNALLGDGSGGVVVFMRASASSFMPIATRIGADATLHTGWPATGLVLSTIATDPFDPTRESQLLPSGPDHLIAVWTVPAGAGTRTIRMQRFGLDATLDPAWPADGLDIVVSDTLQAWSALADGSGGAYVVRQAHGRPVGTHVTAAAEFLGGTDVDLLDAAAEYIPTLFYVDPCPDEIMVDVTPDGGLLVGWNDTRLAPAVSYRLRWLTPSLAPADGKPDTGVVVLPGSPDVYQGSLLALRADGPDAALIAWGDYGEISLGDLYMVRVQAPAIVSVKQPAPRAPALALSAPHPNPARDAVALDATLPDDSPARVVLLDVAGRIRGARIIRGAGASRVEFSGLGALRPGLYFAHLTHPLGTATSRVVVTR